MSFEKVAFNPRLIRRAAPVAQFGPLTHVFSAMKRENPPRKPNHFIDLRLGESRVKLDLPALKVIFVFGVLVIGVLVKEMDLATLRALLRLGP